MDDELPASVLGTHDYWKNCYQNELNNYSDHGDEGEIWFGKTNNLRIVDWIEKNIQKDKTILDVGCGNGVLLVELAKRNYINLFGCDYVDEAIQLCNEIALCENILSIRFELSDILNLDDSNNSTLLDRQFNVVIDKGTYDAICLTPDSNVDEIRSKYFDNISKLLFNNGYFIIMSCNWTCDELKKHFLKDNIFILFHQIHTPSMMFGGKTGNQVTCLVFKKN